MCDGMFGEMQTATAETCLIGTIRRQGKQTALSVHALDSVVCYRDCTSVRYLITTPVQWAQQLGRWQDNLHKSCMIIHVVSSGNC
jgi:hypothetical protein